MDFNEILNWFSMDFDEIQLISIDVNEFRRISIDF
jgi:hypothetical protein